MTYVILKQLQVADLQIYKVQTDTNSRTHCLMMTTLSTTYIYSNYILDVIVGVC